MQYKVKIDPPLLNVYPEIRLGIMQFTAVVQEPSESFWRYMDDYKEAI